MTTVRDLIEDSLKLNQELGAGQSATAEDAADLLKAMIRMLDTWSIQGGGIYTETIESFNLTGGDGTYTMGAGGDFNTTRPVKLRAATYQLSSDTYTQPLEVLSMEEYAYQVDKSTQGYCKRVYFDAGYPLTTLRFHPIPSSSGAVTLYSEKPLTNYTSINDSVILPPGYEDAIVYNLAVKTAPMFGKQAPATVVALAAEYKMAIEAKNMENDKSTMAVDDALVSQRGFDIYSRQ